jgi:hypothetical protein
MFGGFFEHATVPQQREFIRRARIYVRPLLSHLMKVVDGVPTSSVLASSTANPFPHETFYTDGSD